MAKNPDEHPDVKLLVGSRHRVAGKSPRERSPQRRGGGSVHVGRYSEPMRHACEVETRFLRTLHVETAQLIQHLAADAAPVEEAAEVLLVQPIRRNDVPKLQRRRVETSNTFRARAH